TTAVNETTRLFATPRPSVYHLDTPAQIDQRRPPEGALESLPQLLTAVYPTRDYYADELRLTHAKPRPRTVTHPEYQVGNQETFLIDGEPIEALLAYRNDKAYFWFEPAVTYDEAALAAAAARIQDDIYPAVTDLFGTEWIPGIDNDPRIHILHLEQIETEELGYFTSGDVYPQTIFTDSNEREIIYLNMDLLAVGDDYYFGTVTHELQHLIQWYQDSNETTWLDEGLAQLAEIHAGFETVVLEDYLIRPQLQFNTWNYDEDKVLAHYSASALFMIYFWEQLGDAAVRELAAHPADGLASVQAVLQKYRPEMTLDVFIDNWYIANFLHDGRLAADYNYEFPFLPPDVDTTITAAPFESILSLPPYGVRYIELAAGNYNFTFAADTVVDLIETAPHSGRMVWLAPGMNNLTASLYRPFDLTAVDSATLTYWAWYDLEADYDYLYVIVSTDNGNTWQPLQTEGGDYGYYGPALTGRSEELAGQQYGWVQEAVDLSSYAGREVLVGFEVLTDAGVHGRGVALDDIAIAEIGYQTDVETGADGWQAAGFVPVSTQLPQQWSVQIIYEGEAARVEKLVLDGQNQIVTPLEVDERAVIVIAPTTPFTIEEAHYWFRVE
ncbi:MAG: immune inhibitor A, partial [Anaerolineales bacterium]|nr:immune inhibitor A [Anaerolineales bacterium]